MGSLRERPEGSGRWELRVYAGTDATGRQRVRSRTFRGSRRAALKHLGQFQAEVDASGSPTVSLTVSELLERYELKRSPRWSPSTRRNHHQVITTHLTPALGARRADTVRVGDIEDALAHLEATHPATFRKCVAILRAAYNDAMRRELLDRNPAAGVEAPAPRPRAATAPTLAQLAPAITRARTGEVTRGGAGANEGLAVYLRLAAITGARRGELLALCWRDIDSTAGTVAITGAVIADGAGGLTVKATKTGKPRILAIDAATAAELDAWHSHCRVAGLALGSRITTTSFVFSRDNRGTVPWWPDTVSDRWRALADDVGLHGVRLHDLRHTMVSTLTEAGFDPRVIADRAGHTQITTTLGVYAHARPARDQDLAAHLAAQLDAG